LAKPRTTNVNGLSPYRTSEGKEIFSFEYSLEWLKGNFEHRLDPDMEHYRGIQYLNDIEKSNFGLFLDSSPDRWGRLLMKRRESALARFEQRKEIRLFESDYLLGVYDTNRMGALRFKTNIDGDFLDNNKERASPPWTSIRELELISLKLENDAVSDDPDYLKWLNMLVAPGSSLGGARPKASIIDAEGQLWIAKFPSNNDFTDQGAWEMLIQELAIHCGINMSKSVAKRFSSRHHTYLTKRFDRKVNGTRIHFASAMTLLGRIDGDDATEGISYLDIVDFISREGANANTDLE
jgi:serine/threonine-protein kinase HipA